MVAAPDADGAWPLETCLVEGLKAARCDGSVLRLLPLVLVQHWENLEASDLRDAAVSEGVGPELGWLLVTTGGLLGIPELSAWSQGLPTAQPMRSFPQAPNPFALRRAQSLAAKTGLPWGLWVGEAEADLGDWLRKHGALPRGA